MERCELEPAVISSNDAPACEAYDWQGVLCGKPSMWLYLYPPFEKQMFICGHHHYEILRDSPFYFPHCYKEIIASCHRI